MFSLQVRDIFGRYNMRGAISSMFMKMLSVKSHTTGTYTGGAMNMFAKIALVCTVLVCIVNPVISHALPVRSTGRPPVLLVLPSPGAFDISPSSSISVTIDTRAGAPAERFNLRLTTAGRNVPGRVIRDNIHSVISFAPLKHMLKDTPYRVHLEFIEQKDDRYSIKPIFSWEFATGPKPLSEPVTNVEAQLTPPPVPPTNDIPEEEKSQEPEQDSLDLDRIRNLTELFRSRREEKAGGKTAGIKKEPVSPERSKPEPSEEVFKRQHIILTLPSPGAREIATSSSISATIDSFAGIPLKNINLKISVDEKAVPGRITRDLTHNVISFSPLDPLAEEATYQVILEYLKRTNGHYVTEPVFSWGFSTRAPLPATEVAEASVTPLAAEREIFEPTADDRLDKPEEDSSEITRRISEIFSSRGAQPGPAVKIEKEIPGEIPATREPRDEGDTGEDDQVTASIRKLYDIVRDRGGYSPTAQSSSGDRRAGSEQPLAARKPSLEPNQVTENDVLDINIWGHPELSAKYNVSPRGNLGFPLLGDIKVSGKSVEQVKQLLTDRLGKDYIRNPFITIYHRRGRSIRINILGRITRPGIYTFPEPPTLLEAIAAAGGTRPSSGKQEVATIQLVRSYFKEDLDLHDILVNGNFENNYYLEDRDTLILKEELLQERIYIFGSMLKEQGIFRYEPGMTVLDAILLAGGGSTPPEIFEQYRPRFKNTRIVRGYLDKPEVLNVNMDKVLFRGDLSRNVALKPGDIVIVPTRRVTDFWSWVGRIQPLLETIIAGEKVVKIFE